jgi:hypothetical protein
MAANETFSLVVFGVRVIRFAAEFQNPLFFQARCANSLTIRANYEASPAIPTKRRSAD